MALEDALRFDPAAFALAQQRVQAAPIDLTEADFDQLAIVSPQLDAAARFAQTSAQIAHGQAQQTPPPLETKSADPVNIKDFVNADGTRTVTYHALDQTLDEIFRVIKKALDVERARVGALEARNATLDNRVLELEAQRAATAKVEV